ncbi:MAG: dihydropyrimidinase [Thermomicrobiales bacterium]
MGTDFDLVIRGGTVVTAAGRGLADIGVRGEVVVQIGGEMASRREIDATGRFVLPGGVDAHVHLTQVTEPDGSPQWCDDFESGTRAAAAGGVTTVGNMTFPWTGETLRQAVARDSSDAERLALVDVFLHPVLTDPESQPLDEISALAADGHTSLKFFMSFGGFTTQPTKYLEAMRLARDNGMLTVVHCEDAAMLDDAVATLLRDGEGGVEHYPRSRPVASESAATNRIVAFAEETGAPTYVVHLSCAAALDEVRRGRARGVPLWVETRPLYLHLTEALYGDPDGAKYVGQPPLRSQTDREAIWRGIASGEIDTLCTDHAAWTMADKVTPEMDVATVRPGVPDLDTMLPMLFSEGVGTGRISLERFVELTSTNAAKLFGLYPRKGTIAPGADADLVIWDPSISRPVRATAMFTNSDYSPYEGWEVTGWPVTTISRGEVVFDDGRILSEPGRGKVLRRTVTRGL